MNIWDVLKIEQTKDKDALKKAYRMRLSSVNPEDDPEGFMELLRPSRSKYPTMHFHTFFGTST